MSFIARITGPSAQTRYRYYDSITPDQLGSLPNLSREHFDAANAPVADATDFSKQPVLAETDHFFVIAGLGGMVPGYVIVVSKMPEHAFASLPESRMEEAQWLIDTMRRQVQQTYHSGAAVIEHDMVVAKELCQSSACSDIPHVHIMPIPDSKNTAQNIMAHNRQVPTNDKKQFLSSKTVDAGADAPYWQRMDATPDQAINDVLHEMLGAPLAHANLAFLKEKFPDFSYASARGLMQHEPPIPYVLFHTFSGNSDTPDAAHSFVLPYSLWDHEAIRADAGFQKFRRLFDGEHEADYQTSLETKLGSQFGRKIVARMWGIHDEVAGEKAAWNWRHHENYGLKTMHRTMMDLSEKFQALENDPQAQRFGFTNYVTLEWKQHHAVQNAPSLAV